MATTEVPSRAQSAPVAPAGAGAISSETSASPDLGSSSLANRHNALSYSAQFRPPSSSPASQPVPLAHFMGARRDLKGPVLTKQRVAEDEVRPAGWEAAERRAREAENQSRASGAGGLAALMGGRALPGMVSRDKLEADRLARERQEQQGPREVVSGSTQGKQPVQGPSVADMTRKWGTQGSGAGSTPARTQSMSLAERIAADSAKSATL